MADGHSKFADLLREAGLRSTPVRLGVLQVLAKSRRPVDVPAILGKLPSHTDEVTVYRTLNAFTQKRLVHRVRGEDRSWRYAFGDSENQREHQHPHFVCDDCGKVECLATAEIPQGLVKMLGVGRQYTVSHPEVVLHGTCPKCR